jgi:hypothetical protein
MDDFMPLVWFGLALGFLGFAIVGANKWNLKSACRAGVVCGLLGLFSPVLIMGGSFAFHAYMSVYYTLHPNLVNR